MSRFIPHRGFIPIGRDRGVGNRGVVVRQGEFPHGFTEKKSVLILHSADCR